MTSHLCRVLTLSAVNYRSSIDQSPFTSRYPLEAKTMISRTSLIFTLMLGVLSASASWAAQEVPAKSMGQQI